MALFALDDLTPQVDPTAWVAEQASVIGEVIIGPQAGIWYGAVLRGDTAPIRIGARSNVQDNSVLHVDMNVPLVIGEDVTVGHQVVLHGCTIGDGSLIGIQSVVLNRSVIGKDCLVGAGSIVTEGKSFPDRSMILGSPAKVVRELSEENASRLTMSAESYVKRSQDYKANLKRIG
jgi:carbonic anhydrase/acetyltransferase-like protein (isoleucine patch superfamily)